MSTSSKSQLNRIPIIAQHNNNNERSLTFTLENCDVSIANSIRRVVVSEINQYVFRTFPHSENRADFTVNTTRLHNEILKQRLGCVPIHHLHTIDGFGNEYKNYSVTPVPLNVLYSNDFQKMILDLNWMCWDTWN